MQFLIFYAVDNSHGFSRHTFDNIDDKEKIIRKIRALPDEERHIYALTADRDARYSNLDEFVEDYNDEILDGGWWVMRFDY
jgi:DNA-directed RNA polymerase specialized sigma subunit